MKLIRNRDAQFPLAINLGNGTKIQKFTQKAAEELYKKLGEFLGKEQTNGWRNGINDGNINK